MIIYLDTSAFVKLVIDEDGADMARRWFEEASLAISSVITFPEACSALARRAHRREANADRLDEWLSELEARWERTARVRVDERVAGRLAIEHGLRGMDAVHLGAAVAVRERALARSTTAVYAAAFDRRLLEAAEREGFATLGGPLGSDPDRARRRAARAVRAYFAITLWYRPAPVWLWQHRYSVPLGPSTIEPASSTLLARPRS